MIAEWQPVAKACRPCGIYTADKPALALCVAKDSPLHAARDLEGKTVSISGIKDLTHLSVFAYMLKSGADPAKVSFIELPFSQVAAALARGTIAAGIISEPSLSAAFDDVRVLAYAESYIAKRLMVAGWFATLDWFKKNTATAHAFARVIYDAGRWANANQENRCCSYRRTRSSNQAHVRWPGRSSSSPCRRT